MYVRTCVRVWLFIIKAHPFSDSFLSLKTEGTGAEEDSQELSPVPTLESVVSLVTANTTDATVAALAAVQAAAESTIKGRGSCLRCGICTHKLD